MGRDRWSSEAARAERVEAARAVLAEAVTNLRTGEDWRRFLRFEARLHAYSANNVMLIAVQHARAFEAGTVATPFPSSVASYRRWQQLGRQVEKGQHGYVIFAPMRGVRRIATGEDGQSRELGRDEQLNGGETAERVGFLRGFTVESVFAAEQTSGTPLPEPPRPRLLEGDAPAGLGAAVLGLVEARGFTVDTVAAAGLLGGANGRTNFTDRTVLIRADMDDAAMVRTLLHEAAHVLLHDPQREPAGSIPARDRLEVEAESVAFIVADAHDMPAGGYSFPYVAAWAGDDPQRLIAQAATRVARAAKEILAVSPASHTAGGCPPDPIAVDRAPTQGGPSPDALQVGA